MALIDSLIGTAGQWVSSSDPKATLLQPLEWLKKTGSYAAVNRIIGMAIPFAPRNHLIQETLYGRRASPKTVTLTFQTSLFISNVGWIGAHNPLHNFHTG